MVDLELRIVGHVLLKLLERMKKPPVADVASTAHLDFNLIVDIFVCHFGVLLGGLVICNTVKEESKAEVESSEGGVRGFLSASSVLSWAVRFSELLTLHVILFSHVWFVYIKQFASSLLPKPKPLLASCFASWICFLFVSQYHTLGLSLVDKFSQGFHFIKLN